MQNKFVIFLNDHFFIFHINNGKYRIIVIVLNVNETEKIAGKFFGLLSSEGNNVLYGNETCLIHVTKTFHKNSTQHRTVRHFT